MKIFLDTADTQTIIKGLATGLIDGVTTNPTLIRKSGQDPYLVYDAIRDLGVTDISMEVYGDIGEMYSEALKLADRYGDVATIKLPMTEDGLRACKVLSPRVKTNITLVFNTAQAVLAT